MGIRWPRDGEGIAAWILSALAFVLLTLMIVKLGFIMFTDDTFPGFGRHDRACITQHDEIADSPDGGKKVVTVCTEYAPLGEGR